MGSSVAIIGLSFFGTFFGGAIPQVAGKSKTMTSLSSFSSRFLTDRQFRREQIRTLLFYLWAAACLAFILWAAVDIKHDAIAERDRLEQRINALERIVAEQGARLEEKTRP